jgi:hypothetical protein
LPTGVRTALTMYASATHFSYPERRGILTHQ